MYAYTLKHMLLNFVVAWLALLPAASPPNVVENKPTLKKHYRAQQVASAQNLNVVIVGPETVTPGTLVKLDASKSDGDTFSWTLADGNSESYEVSDDGKKVYFANTVPGRYPFVFAAAKKNADGPPILVLTEHVLTVQGVNPKPVDPVNPQPQPTDPLPTGKYGLARFVRDTVNANVPSGSRSLANGFSSNYSVIAAQIDAKSLSGKNMVMLKLKDKNQATVGTQKDSWKSTFDAISKKLQDMEASKVVTPTDQELSDELKEISLGFAAAGGS